MTEEAGRLVVYHEVVIPPRCNECGRKLKHPIQYGGAVYGPVCYSRLDNALKTLIEVAAQADSELRTEPQANRGSEDGSLAEQADPGVEPGTIEPLASQANAFLDLEPDWQLVCVVAKTDHGYVAYNDGERHIAAADTAEEAFRLFMENPLA